jgi:hypothetical protein
MLKVFHINNIRLFYDIFSPRSDLSLIPGLAAVPLQRSTNRPAFPADLSNVYKFYRLFGVTEHTGLPRWVGYRLTIVHNGVAIMPVGNRL